MSPGDVEGDISIDQGTEGSMSQLRREPQDVINQQSEQEELQQAITASELDAQRHTIEALEHKRQMEQVLAQSVLDQ